MASNATAFSDMAPSPRVVIDIDDADLNPDTITATILQISNGDRCRSPMTRIL